ncbi:MAG: hypothetical protein EBZ49_00830 [Proteobacteria bacterium]|nr:hypothetical protein [Pseudomonadota bacterium]
MAFKVLLIDEVTGKLKRGENLPSTYLSLGGKMVLSARSISVNAIIESSDYYIGVNSSNSPITVTLPDLSEVEPGQEFVIKDEGGQAGINKITVDGNGALIDGSSSFQIAAPRDAIKCIARDSFWSII